MTHSESAAPSPVPQGLFPMLLLWSRFITWTVLLSALMAVLFALAIDGCGGR